MSEWLDDNQCGDDRCVACNHKGHRHEVAEDRAGVFLGACYGLDGLPCDCERFVSPSDD